MFGGTKQSSDMVSKLNWERKDRGGGGRKEGGEAALKPVGRTLGRMLSLPAEASRCISHTHPASQFPGTCDRGFLLPSKVRPTPTSLFQTEFLPALCSQRGVCLLIYHWHAGNSLEMSCNHLSPAIAVWLSSNLSFPPVPPSLMPSSPLPIKPLLEYAHLVQGTRYYAMFPKQPVNKKEALTVGTLPLPKDKEVFQRNTS